MSDIPARSHGLEKDLETPQKRGVFQALLQSSHRPLLSPKSSNPSPPGSQGCARGLPRLCSAGFQLGAGRGEGLAEQIPLGMRAGGAGAAADGARPSGSSHRLLQRCPRGPRSVATCEFHPHSSSGSSSPSGLRHQILSVGFNLTPRLL